MVEERVAALELELRLREPLPDVIHGNERPRRNVRTVDADGLGKEKVQRQLINALCAWTGVHVRVRIRVRARVVRHDDALHHRRKAPLLPDGRRLLVRKMGPDDWRRVKRTGMALVLDGLTQVDELTHRRGAPGAGENTSGGMVELMPSQRRPS